MECSDNFGNDKIYLLPSKCPDRSMEVQLPAGLLTDRQTNQPTERRTDQVKGKFYFLISDARNRIEGRDTYSRVESLF